ncbi:MAG: hypothetical protein HY959_03530 [Ignavibacteriae bacterium]|nr:hypothetical protein [Ignavibacteriota bacterium]
MKIILLFLTLTAYSVSEAGSCDTAFTAGLFESVKSKVYIKYGCDENGYLNDGNFTLTIDGITIKDSCVDAYDGMESMVLDVDKNDKYKEIAVLYYFSINTSYQIYRFDGKKIISLGVVYSNEQPVLPGDGTVKATGWMGFWSYDFEFVLNKNKMKFEPVYKDEYPVKFYEGFDGEIIVKESFSTFKERDKNSAVVTKFKKGDKIQFIKAYVKVKCDDVDYNDPCFWYLIKDKDGKKGWLQLRDFQEKVDGIPWAG